MTEDNPMQELAQEVKDTYGDDVDWDIGPLGVALIADNRSAIDRYGVEDFVHFFFRPEWIERCGFERLVQIVRFILDKEEEISEAEEAKELEGGLTVEELQDRRFERLLEEAVLASTLRIDNDRVWELDRAVSECLDYFYFGDTNGRKLHDALNPELRDLSLEYCDKTPKELIEEILSDPNLRDEQREAVVEALELYSEYIEEVDRWVHEEGLDDLASEQAFFRLLGQVKGTPKDPNSKKSLKREERRKRRKAKRKGKRAEKG